MKIIKRLLLCIFIIFLLIAWLYSMQQTFSFRSNKNLSEENIVKIDTILRKNNVAGIQVISINLEDNTKKVIYGKYTDPFLDKLHITFIMNTVTIELPAFTKDEINDARLIRIINHEFICTPFVETTSYKYAPEAAKKVSTVCGMSIPPSFGRFYGLIGIFLIKEPTPEEKDIVRIILKDLSESLSVDLKP